MPPVYSFSIFTVAMRIETTTKQMSRTPMAPNVAHVRVRRQETSDVWTLEIDPGPDFDCAFTPGQFNMLTAFGVGEAAISFSGDPVKPRFIHTIRAVGAVSTALTRLEIGAPLGVRGPFGVGWPLPSAKGKDVLVIAGGLGLAPLRPVIYRLLAERDQYRNISVLYGARSAADIPFGSELSEWRNRHEIDVEITLDHASVDWQGHVGVVTSLIQRARITADSTIAMLCGPEIMMRFAAVDLLDRGLREDAIFLSMERNMKCAIGHCGHCQFSPVFICRDGPVFPYGRLKNLLAIKEL